MATVARRAGGGWIAFSGTMLIIAGLIDFFDGLWAIRTSDTQIDSLFFNNNLNAWGWFYVILGIVLIVAGFAVFARQPWAAMVGIVFATVAAVLNMFWIFTFPIASLVLVLLNVLVVYGLTVYGLPEDKGAY
jgi:hypothetical protein